MSFEYWDTFKNKINTDKLKVNIKTLSPQHKENIIPYILDKIASQEIVRIFTEIKKYAVYNGVNNTKPYIANNFVIDDNYAYFINPLKQEDIQTAYERSNALEIPKFSRVGIISADHNIFRSEKKEQLVIENDHGSLKFFRKLISISANHNASDIHIAPRNKTHVYFRLRINGILFDNLVDDINVKEYQLLANQIITHASGEAGNFINILSNKFNFINVEDDVDVSVRVSMLPTEFLFENKSPCPRFVLRLHNNKQADIKTLDNLGLNAHLFKKITELTSLNQGLVVVTGPTGSGKTTLLYALLNAINASQRGRSIQTLEDPVEQNLINIDQCSINVAAGIDYATGLKAFLRQDLDVALIGEIRDEITAAKTTEVAMTGHLALSTIHTNTALGTINRLRRLGIDDRDTADTLKSVISARLVRTICTNCAKPTTLNNPSFDKYRTLVDKTVNNKYNNYLIAGDGCIECKFSAYIGRTLVAEIFTIDAHAQKMIVAQKPLTEIEQYLVSQNEQTIWHHAVELLSMGVTTIRELEHVLPPYSGCM